MDGRPQWRELICRIHDLLEEDDADVLVLKVLDFGLARSIEELSTAPTLELPGRAGGDVEVDVEAPVSDLARAVEMEALAAQLRKQGSQRTSPPACPGTL